MLSSKEKSLQLLRPPEHYQRDPQESSEILSTHCKLSVTER